MKRAVLASTSSGEQDAHSMISSTISELVEIFNGWQNVRHVPFFEGIWCWDWVLEPVNLPMDEIFGLHGKLVGLRHKIFQEEERAMVHVIPWVFWGG